jgi:hypothetical protein
MSGNCTNGGNSGATDAYYISYAVLNGVMAVTTVLTLLFQVINAYVTRDDLRDIFCRRRGDSARGIHKIIKNIHTQPPSVNEALLLNTPKSSEHSTSAAATTP